MSYSVYRPSYPPTAVPRKPLPPSTQSAPLSMVTQNTRNMTPTSGHPPPPLESSLHPRTSNPLTVGLRVLNGRVVKVREWLTLGVPFPVVYRVYGELVTAIMPGISGNKRVTGRKVFILEDQVDSSQKIRCHFQDIDRDLGTFKARESVVVVGRGMGDGMMQVFSVESFKPEEVLPHLARMENFAVRGLRLGMRELSG